MKTDSTRKGALVISLDFELMWGMKDSAAATGYDESNLKQAPEVVKRLLEAFNRHGVHATFATVGLIMLPGRDEAVKMTPDQVPAYRNMALSVYADNYLQSIADPALHFAPHLVKQIAETPGMEMGTHTFGHYYCTEPGQTIEQFDADLDRAVQTADGCGLTLSSIVFPRNQVTTDGLAACRRHGLMIYRGNARHLFRLGLPRWQDLAQRVMRLADTYIPLAGRQSYTWQKAAAGKDGMHDIRASRFLRPRSRRMSWLEPLKLRRIMGEMTRAARRGEIYHLWWHPHNFGNDIEGNMRDLERILTHYDTLRARYSMQSLNMKETAALAAQTNK